MCSQKSIQAVRTRGFMLFVCILAALLLPGTCPAESLSTAPATGVSVPVSRLRSSTTKADSEAPLADAPPQSQSAATTSSQPASQPSTQPAGPGREAIVTPEIIESARAQVRASTTLSEAERKPILDVYDLASESTRVAQDWQKQATRYQMEIEQVPAKFEQASAKLALPVEDLAPTVPAGASFSQIEKLYRAADEADRAARVEAASLVREQEASQDRKEEINARRAAIREQAGQVVAELNPRMAATTEMGQAQRMRLQAQATALWQEYIALDKRRQYDDSRQPLLTMQIDLANRYQRAADAAVTAWKKILEREQAAELQRVAEQARQQLVARRQDLPAIRRIAQDNEQLAQQRLALSKAVDSLGQVLPSRDEVIRLRRRVSDNSRNMVQRMEAIGQTEAISAQLRRHRVQLPDVASHERNRHRLEAEIARTQMELIDLEEERSALSNIDQQTDQVLDEIKGRLSDPERQDARQQVRDLLLRKRTLLDGIIQDYNTAAQNWFELEAEERLLVEATTRYAEFIDEHILWVRSARPLQVVHIRHGWGAARWLIDPMGWKDIGYSLWVDLQRNPLMALLGPAVLGLLLGMRRRLRQQLHLLDHAADSGRTYAFSQTLEATAITLLLAAPWPIFLWSEGWRLSKAVSAGDLAAAVAVGLKSTAGLFLIMEIGRQVCRRRGLGRTHLRWPDESVLQLLLNLSWSMPFFLVLTFIISTMNAQANLDYKDSLGRLAFMVLALVLTLLVARLLHPRYPLIGHYLKRHPDGWGQRLRYVWYPAAVCLPAALTIATSLGYTYAAVQIVDRLLSTAVLIFGILIIKALLLRLLFVARRHLAIETARKRQAAKVAQTAASAADARGSALVETVPGQSSTAVVEDEIDLAAVDTQTRRLVSIGVLVAVLLGLWGIWAGFLPALGILDRVTLWSTTQGLPSPGSPDGGLYAITLGRVFFAILIMGMAIVAARNIPGLLEITLLRLMPLDSGIRYAINAITRYSIIIIGVIIAFSKIGLGWSKVQWLVAAMTVGLGFGLQEIFANFVSGLIILFERPVRVGDIVTVGTVSGTVSRINIRATTIIDWDYKELIVPNKEFITSQLINWTLSDPTLRVVVDVGVAYGSKTPRVQELLLEIAANHPNVLTKPAPSAYFLGFGDSSLNFSLRVFVPGPSVMLTVKHDLHTAIDQAFRKEGIEIAFPQRDINIRQLDISGLLPSMERKSNAAPDTGDGVKGG